MKILMTGMASSHCQIKGNTTFFSTLYTALSEVAEVTISEPKLSWGRADLQKFDAVIVGLTPPTSLSANKIYAALHVLDLMYESPKLRLVIDDRQVWQYKNSLKSFTRNPMQILSIAFCNRKDYKLALDEHSISIKSVADKMATLQWPKSYVPLLPWGSVKTAAKSLEFIPEDRLVGLKIDALLLDKQPAQIGRHEQWAVEDINSSWWAKVSQTLRFGGVSTALNKRSNDEHADKTMRDSIGLIAPPQGRKAGTWWSYRYVQALNTSTPIVTDWRDSRSLSGVWAMLAYQVEDMEPYERQYLADLQYKSYVNSIPTKEELLNTLATDLIDSTKERENA
jgi:hypothetical protein